MLLAYFRRARTFHLLTGDLLSLNNILSIFHSPRPLTAEHADIRNLEDMESLLTTEVGDLFLLGKDKGDYFRRLLLLYLGYE